jgi:uncharacterized protein YkwD
VAALAGAMILALLPATAMAGANDVPRATTQAEWQVLSEINHYRASRGLAPLRMAQAARVAARERSEEMSSRNYLSHSSPTGRDAATMLARRSVSYQAGAENIGRISFFGWDSAVKGIMNGWKNSAGHNQSILSNTYNYVGIGVARTENVAYFTTIFLLQKDHTAPKSGMVAAATGISVAATAAGARPVTVRWWGRDPMLQRHHAGIRSFTVQHKRVGGSTGWHTVKGKTLAHSMTMTLTKGKHKFRVRAVDRAGNVGNWRRPVTVTVN